MGGMRGKIERLVRRLGGVEPGPFAHLTDAKLLDALARARRGEDPGVVPRVAGPTGYEHLTDEQLMTALWGPRERWPAHVERAVAARRSGSAPASP